MNCRTTAQGAKRFYEDNEGEFLPERDEAFQEFAADQMSEWIEEYLDNVEEDSLPSLNDFLVWLNDEEKFTESDFQFPVKDVWLGDKYESALGDCADAAYEEYKDRKMGIV